MIFAFNHFNFNVLNYERSLEFYREQLGLLPLREKQAEDGSYKMAFLGDGITGFSLEITWLREHTEAYDLGEQEYHLAFRTDDYEAAHEKHKAAGVICLENTAMGLYFIEDPDGYWIEILPHRR